MGGEWNVWTEKSGGGRIHKHNESRINEKIDSEDIVRPSKEKRIRWFEYIA